VAWAFAKTNVLEDKPFTPVACDGIRCVPCGGWASAKCRRIPPQYGSFATVNLVDKGLFTVSARAVKRRVHHFHGQHLAKTVWEFFYAQFLETTNTVWIFARMS